MMPLLLPRHLTSPHALATHPAGAQAQAQAAGKGQAFAQALAQAQAVSKCLPASPPPPPPAVTYPKCFGLAADQCCTAAVADDKCGCTK